MNGLMGVAKTGYGTDLACGCSLSIQGHDHVCKSGSHISKRHEVYGFTLIIDFLENLTATHALPLNLGNIY